MLSLTPACLADEMSSATSRLNGLWGLRDDQWSWIIQFSGIGLSFFIGLWSRGILTSLVLSIVMGLIINVIAIGYLSHGENFLLGLLVLHSSASASPWRLKRYAAPSHVMAAGRNALSELTVLFKCERNHRGTETQRNTSSGSPELNKLSRKSLRNTHYAIIS